MKTHSNSGQKLPRRAVITGLGVISPIGIGKIAFWQSLEQGKSGITNITRFDCTGFPSQVAGEVNDFSPQEFMGAIGERRMDRFTQFGVAAAKIALKDSGLPVDQIDRTRLGVVMGTALGGMPYAEYQCAIYQVEGLKRLDPLLATKLFDGELSSQISIEFGIKGPSYTLSNACAAATDAIGYATALIRGGVIDGCITGGAEAALTPITFGAFCRVGALTTRTGNPKQASCPFDKDRDGFVMSEGAGIIILEELESALSRKAHIYAEVAGYAAVSEAYHMTRATEEADGFIRAMKLALADAQLDPQEIDYVNAHGTSTPLNDKTETLAIKQVFGNRAYSLPISSIKSMIGHPIGAAGGIEVVASALVIENQYIPPTINYQTKDPECDLFYVPNNGMSAQVRTILKNSAGFGSVNASVILRQYNTG